MGVNGHWYVEMRKQAYWRGNPHTWVNRYVMSGAQPTAADALTVIDAIHAIENAIYPNVGAGGGQGFVDGKAYPSGNGSFFAIREYNEGLDPGDATGFSGSAYGATSPTLANTLEVCFMLETPLNGLSSTGKPVYLRKFYRGLSMAATETGEGGAIPTSVISAVEEATLPFQTGLAANNWVVIGNKGEQASGPPVLKEWEYNRQIPKGRRRATSGPSVLGFLDEIVRARGVLGLAADAAEVGVPLA